jgi:hypothetical protein
MLLNAFSCEVGEAFGLYFQFFDFFADLAGLYRGSGLGRVRAFDLLSEFD